MDELRTAAVSGAQKQATGNGKPETGNEERGPGLRIGAGLAQRLIAFASSVIEIARTMPKDPAARHVALQVIRSSTSAGANYEEARAAESRLDFIHKLGISTKELRETIYWLELIRSAKLSTPGGLGVEPILHEAAELGSILGASIRTAKKHVR